MTLKFSPNNFNFPLSHRHHFSTFRPSAIFSPPRPSPSSSTWRPPVNKWLEMKDARSAVIVYEHKDGSQVTVRIPDLTGARLIYWQNQEQDEFENFGKFGNFSGSRKQPPPPIITKRPASLRMPFFHPPIIPGYFFFKHHWLGKPAATLSALTPPLSSCLSS